MNPFERPQKEEVYEPDQEILELLVIEARKALAKEDKTVDEKDIRGGVVRAMRAADKAGDPFTKEMIQPGDAELDAKLIKATNIQTSTPTSGYRLADADSTIIRQAPSQAELEKRALEERQAYER